jgi:GT2 family glycosyltransferase
VTRVRRVSAIIVSFNAGEHLLASVRSLLASDATTEVFVVDNASRDGSLEDLRRALRNDSRVHLLESSENVGFARAVNRALALCGGEHVLLLNPDCQVRAGTLERLSAQLDASPDIGMAGPLILNPNGSEQAGCRRATPTPGRAFIRAFGLGRLETRGLRDFVLTGDPLPHGPVDVDAISGACMMVRRQAIETVGAMDEGYFLHCEDLDWCRRFQQAGLRVSFVPDAVAVHEKGRSSRDRPVRVLWHMHRGMVRYYRKFFRDAYPAPLLWLVTLGVWLRFGVLATWALLARLGLAPRSRRR